MLDVHPPHHKIHGVKEFLVHLFTITIGLLIAVGIEGCVERHQHQELANEARATLKAEIQTNAETIDDALKAIAREREQSKKNLDTVSAIQLHPEDKNAQNASISADYNSVGLRNTAWKTAQATGALSYIPYQEAEKYSSIYQAQEDFFKEQEQIAQDAALYFGLVERFRMKNLTRDEASLIAERLGVWQGHLLQLDITAKVLQEQQLAFLQGREPKHNMSERM